MNACAMFTAQIEKRVFFCMIHNWNNGNMLNAVIELSCPSTHIWIIYGTSLGEFFVFFCNCSTTYPKIVIWTYVKAPNTHAKHSEPKPYGPSRLPHRISQVRPPVKIHSIRQRKNSLNSYLHCRESKSKSMGFSFVIKVFAIATMQIGSGSKKTSTSTNKQKTKKKEK